jgi:hypothetical protein
MRDCIGKPEVVCVEVIDADCVDVEVNVIVCVRVRVNDGDWLLDAVSD